MGCDIHTCVEQRESNGWTWISWGVTNKYGDCEPFGDRIYAVFGWLADVRNYSAVPPISQPRGLPGDTSPDVLRVYEEWGFDAHSASWLSVDELLAFDYRKTFEDRRVTRGNDGGVTAEPGGGRLVTYRGFLGRSFFDDLDRLVEFNKAAPTRVVFWFDN